MQSTLSALADIDCVFERNLETVTTSGAPEAIKKEAIKTLQQRHQDARVSYVRQPKALHRRAMTAALVSFPVPSSLQQLDGSAER